MHSHICENYFLYHNEYRFYFKFFEKIVDCRKVNATSIIIIYLCDISLRKRKEQKKDTNFYYFSRNHNHTIDRQNRSEENMKQVILKGRNLLITFLQLMMLWWFMGLRITRHRTIDSTAIILILARDIIK